MMGGNMDWTSIIIALITSGAFLGIFTIRETKTKMMLDNGNKINEQWAAFAEKEEERRKELKEDLDAKDRKIDKLYSEITVLRDKNDKLASRVAFLTAYRCKKVNCIEREPPFGTNLNKEKEAE